MNMPLIERDIKKWVATVQMCNVHAAVYGPPKVFIASACFPLSLERSVIANTAAAAAG